MSQDDFEMPKKKKRVNGKSKGGSFERRIAVELSQWWSDCHRDDLFWRTASSGGRATQRKKKGKQTGDSGDIASTDPFSTAMTKVFSIELKCGYNSNTLDVLLRTPDKSGLTSFFNQAVESQSQSNARSWLVIHKIDRKPIVLYMPTDTFNELCLYRKENKLPLVDIPYLNVVIPDYRVTCMLFDSFMLMFNRHDIERLLEYF